MNNKPDNNFHNVDFKLDNIDNKLADLKQLGKYDFAKKAALGEELMSDFAEALRDIKREMATKL